MKLQYLGDSKDSFKWDYHDFLVSELGYPLFNIALMMTPDRKDGHGMTSPTSFPARDEITDFCLGLKRSRSIQSIAELPKITGASYRVDFHNGGVFLNHGNRAEYFQGFSRLEDQVVFLDPDTGFEPEKSFDDAHVGYGDVAQILDQLSDESVVSVFQHQRRRTFKEDFASIRERIQSGRSIAIYWHSLMFVAISKSEAVLDRVREANAKYAHEHRLEVIT